MIEQTLISFTPPIKKQTITWADYGSIRDTVPCLEDNQCEDVLRIEKRFMVGKGYLCTNSTGTGKTFVGLGIINRFLYLGKERILIVVPTDQKCHDWKAEASEHFKVDVHMAEGLNDIGKNVTVMTYANFYQNKKIGNIWWDLIVYDESHYLVQNGAGKTTVYLKQHFKCSNVWSTARSKAVNLLGYPPSRQDNDYDKKIGPYREQYEAKVQQIYKKTKVLFLSATPFAYRKNLIYGDGTIFNDMNEQHPLPPVNDRYNQPNSRYEEFMIKYFGYRMKTNKLTIPETGVDMNLLEREFFEKHVKKGVMSTRQLMVEKDYSRHFVKLESEEALSLNKGLKFTQSSEFKKKYPKLHEYNHKHFDYRFINKLLEISKAKYIHERIKLHLYLGRQVVIFHSFNHANIDYPFRYDVDKMLSLESMYDRYPLSMEINRFAMDYPEFWNLDFSELLNPREAILKYFPDTLFFNGTVGKKKRKKNIEMFQDDYSDHNIIMVQSAAGREGISLHDRTMFKQRVSIDLSLPIVPVEATQKEGRIYRNGVKSNAIYEYITLQYWFEENAFAVKIAERARTVENLAMGHLARDLETAFKEGYQNFTVNLPNVLQGIKGKITDRSVMVVDEYEKAKAYYYMRSKNDSSLKYFDYYATPEPLGYMMIKWIDVKHGSKFLEPSSGHGSIGRWLDARTNNVYIEPVSDLASKTALNCTGTVINTDFESHHIVNKYNYIAMNPPFGHGGKIAGEHLEKAMKHGDRLGCNLIAILPCGNLMEKRLEELLANKESERWVFAVRVLLPDCVFKKEQTSVLTQLVKFQTLNNYGPDEPYTRELDLRYITDIKEFFDVIKDMDL